MFFATGICQQVLIHFSFFQWAQEARQRNILWLFGWRVFHWFQRHLTSDHLRSHQHKPSQRSHNNKVKSGTQHQPQWPQPHNQSQWERGRVRGVYSSTGSNEPVSQPWVFGARVNFSFDGSKPPPPRQSYGFTPGTCAMLAGRSLPGWRASVKDASWSQ